MEAGILAGGIIVALAVFFLLLFKIFPRADHIVKKDHGIYEAMFFTRFCALVVYLPLVVCTVFFLVVIIFKPDKGVALIEEICPDDFGCANKFSWGREQFDKSVCTTVDCGEKNLLARSGSRPLKFQTFGLGYDLDPEFQSRTYDCEVGNDPAVCESYSIGSGESCSCERFNKDLGICEKITGCDGDINKTIHTTTCTTVDSLSGICESFVVDADSAKQFTLKSCNCTSQSSVETLCEEFVCDEVTMPYYYPNTFVALMTILLIILPLLLITYAMMKTQARKVIKCGEIQLNVYSQDAGMIRQERADFVAAGGFTTQQKIGAKTKYKRTTVFDVVAILIGLFLVFGLSWIVVIISGRIGFSLVIFTVVMIVVIELIRWVRFFLKRQKNLKDRVEQNMG